MQTCPPLALDFQVGCQCSSEVQNSEFKRAAHCLILSPASLRLHNLTPKSRVIKKYFLIILLFITFVLRFIVLFLHIWLRFICSYTRAKAYRFIVLRPSTREKFVYSIISPFTFAVSQLVVKLAGQVFCCCFL